MKAETSTWVIVPLQGTANFSCRMSDSEYFCLSRPQIYLAVGEVETVNLLMNGVGWGVFQESIIYIYIYQYDRLTWVDVISSPISS